MVAPEVGGSVAPDLGELLLFLQFDQGDGRVERVFASEAGVAVAVGGFERFHHIIGPKN